MKLTGFFKTPKHRIFNYKPRYYDPEQEDFNEKLEKKQTENFIKSEQEKQKIHHQFEIRRSEEKRSYAFRLLVILTTFVLLTIALYYGFKIVNFLK